jgi:formate-dependent nitrite reductase membrane component NrfD
MRKTSKSTSRSRSYKFKTGKFSSAVNKIILAQMATFFIGFATYAEAKTYETAPLWGQVIIAVFLLIGIVCMYATFRVSEPWTGRLAESSGRHWITAIFILVAVYIARWITNHRKPNA